MAGRRRSNVLMLWLCLCLLVAASDELVIKLTGLHLKPCGKCPDWLYCNDNARCAPCVSCAQSGSFGFPGKCQQWPALCISVYPKPFVCPKLSLQGGGNLTCDYDFWLGSTCNVTCPGASLQTTRCVWNDDGQSTQGTWDPPPDQCVVTARREPIPRDRSVTYSDLPTPTTTLPPPTTQLTPVIDNSVASSLGTQHYVIGVLVVLGLVVLFVVALAVVLLVLIGRFQREPLNPGPAGEIELREVNRNLLSLTNPPPESNSSSIHVNTQLFESGRLTSVGSYAQRPTSPPREIESCGDSARRSSSPRPRPNSTSGVGTWTQSATEPPARSSTDTTTEPYPYSVSVGTPRPSPELVSSNSSDGTGSSLDMTNQNVPTQQSDISSAEEVPVSNDVIRSTFSRDVGSVDGAEDTYPEETSGLLLSSSLHTSEVEDTALKTRLTTFQQPQSLTTPQKQQPPQQPQEHIDPSSLPECSLDGYSGRSWNNQYQSDSRS